MRGAPMAIRRLAGDRRTRRPSPRSHLRGLQAPRRRGRMLVAGQGRNVDHLCPQPDRPRNAFAPVSLLRGGGLRTEDEWVYVGTGDRTFTVETREPELMSAALREARRRSQPAPEPLPPPLGSHLELGGRMRTRVLVMCMSAVTGLATLPEVATAEHAPPKFEHGGGALGREQQASRGIRARARHRRWCRRRVTPPPPARSRRPPPGRPKRSATNRPPTFALAAAVEAAAAWTGMDWG